MGLMAPLCGTQQMEKLNIESLFERVCVCVCVCVCACVCVRVLYVNLCE